METTMDITVRLPMSADGATIAKVLRDRASLFDGGKSTMATTATAAAPMPANKPAKAAKAAKVEDEQFDLDQEETDEDPLGIEEEQDETPAITKEDVIKALSGYVKKHSREKAMKLMKKFVQTGAVRDLPTDKYGAVLKALGV